MKHLSILCISYLLIPAVHAQRDTSTQTFLNNICEHVYMPLLANNVSKKLKVEFPFNNIEVVDYRPDSSRIGLFMVRGQQHDLLFASSASNEIRSFLNKDYTNLLASKTLLVVIRKLWFSDIPYEKYSSKEPSPYKSRISLRVETYLKESSGYIPLTFFDTLVMSSRPLLDMARFRLPDLMASFMKKINSLDVHSQTIKNRRAISYEAVDSFSNRNFLYPIDTAIAMYKGVYASFEDFKNNRPTVFNYEIGQEENSFKTLHLKDEQGKSYYSRKMWGFCDGQHAYVMMDGNLFPILTADRAYYVYGSKEYMIKKKNLPFFVIFPGALIYGSLSISERVTRKLRLFGIDMESGEIF